MRITQDVVGGLLFAGIGAFALGVCWDYEVGSALRMGPGYFPRIVSGLMLLLGVMNLVRGLLSPSAEVITGFAWRPLCIVSLSIVGFALTVQPFGVVVSVTCLVVGSWLANAQRRLRTLPLLLAVGIALPILIFMIGLKMPLKLLGF